MLQQCCLDYERIIMSSILTSAQKVLIKAELLQLLANLREDTGYHADLKSTLKVVNITRHLQEIKDCQHALQRLARGHYGLCIGCKEEIELNRLKANPVACRCLSCQSQQAQQRLEIHYASM